MGHHLRVRSARFARSAEPKGQPDHNPLFKIHPFMDLLIENFQKSYIPSRELSLDESMIGFKGRLGFIQYMPKKPTKWGLKAFILADGVTGYALNWKLYTGGWVKNSKYVMSMPTPFSFFVF